MKSALLPLQKAILTRIKSTIETSFTGSVVVVEPPEGYANDYVLIGEDEETDWSTSNCEGSENEHIIRCVSRSMTKAKQIESKVTELLTDRTLGDLILDNGFYIVTWRKNITRTIKYAASTADKYMVFEVMTTFIGKIGRN